MLHVAEGTGHHVMFFAESYKNLKFWPTEYKKKEIVILNENL